MIFRVKMMGSSMMTYMKVWYDSGWSSGNPTYSSMLNVTTFLKLIHFVRMVYGPMDGRRIPPKLALLD
jgi:hypothetical protein